MSQILGLDIGGTSLKLGAWEHSGNQLTRIAWQDGIPTPMSTDTDTVLLQIIETLSAFARDNSIAPAAIGIGSCGLIVGGEILQSPNTPWDYLPLEAALEPLFNAPVRLLNDADAFLLGAMTLLGALPASAIGITLGTGIGTSFWLDGRILLGGSGVSPEGGHITLDYRGEVGSAGIAGDWEVIAGRDALLRYYAEAGGEAAEALPIALAADDGEHAARAAWERYGLCVGVGLGSLCNIFSPEVILIGGGMAGAHRHFDSALQKALHSARLRAMPASRLQYVDEQPDTVALGAARWAAQGQAATGAQP